LDPRNATAGEHFIDPGVEESFGTHELPELLRDLPHNTSLRLLSYLQSAAGQFQLVALVQEQRNTTVQQHNALHENTIKRHQGRRISNAVLRWRQPSVGWPVQAMLEFGEA
jgi:hypothetical protein